MRRRPAVRAPEGSCPPDSGADAEFEALRLDRQLCFPLYAAARKVIALYTPYLKPLGLTYTQYLVFLALWEHDGIPVGELGERLRLDSGTLTPVLKRMECDGLLTRNRSRSDERVVCVGLTERGWALRQELRDLPQRIGACVRLSKEDMRELHRLLYLVLRDG